MTDPRGRVEKARLAARLSQAQIAERLGVSQGHYSKVVTAKVPLADELRGRMEAWLDDEGAGAIGVDVTRRMQELAASIRRECMELMHLAGLASGDIFTTEGGSGGSR